jgi:hypothetical protein
MNTKQINLSEDIVVKAEARARALGLTLTEYVQSLVDKDMKAKEYDPWREPVPKEVAEEWSRDIAETEAYEKLHPRPSVKTVEELMKLLDEEAAKLPDDDEGH